MTLSHRFITDLNTLEQNQTYCGNPLHSKMKTLFIGTFNPNNESCLKRNTATWFYGRNKSNFWRYMPNSLTGITLHPLDGIENTPQVWKNYCVENKLVIIDLVKQIREALVLEDFGDRKVDNRIGINLENVDIINVKLAFKDVQFDRVIYSLKWTDRNITKLNQIRDLVNKSLLDVGCINNMNQIFYCWTPSRNDQNTVDSWQQAINGNQ
jgi:hypothetical protein